MSRMRGLPQQSGPSFGGMDISPEQFDQLKMLGSLGGAGVLDNSQLQGMFAETLLAKPDPFQQMIEQYMSGMGGGEQQGMGGMPGMDGGMPGQDPMAGLGGQGGGYDYGMGGNDLAIEVPDALTTAGFGFAPVDQMMQRMQGAQEAGMRPLRDAGQTQFNNIPLLGSVETPTNMQGYQQYLKGAFNKLF